MAHLHALDSQKSHKFQWLDRAVSRIDAVPDPIENDLSARAENLFRFVGAATWKTNRPPTPVEIENSPAGAGSRARESGLQLWSRHRSGHLDRGRRHAVVSIISAVSYPISARG